MKILKLYNLLVLRNFLILPSPNNKYFKDIGIHTFVYTWISHLAYPPKAVMKYLSTILGLTIRNAYLVSNLVGRLSMPCTYGRRKALGCVLNFSGSKPIILFKSRAHTLHQLESLLKPQSPLSSTPSGSKCVRACACLCGKACTCAGKARGCMTTEGPSLLYPSKSGMPTHSRGEKGYCRMWCCPLDRLDHKARGRVDSISLMLLIISQQVLKTWEKGRLERERPKMR